MIPHQRARQIRSQEIVSLPEPTRPFTPTQGRSVAKTPNYTYEKRAKEAAKNKKKEEKLKRKQEKKAAAPEDGQENAPEE